MAFDKARSALGKLRAAILASQFKADSRMQALDSELQSWLKCIGGSALRSTSEADTVLDTLLAPSIQKATALVNAAPAQGGIDWLVSNLEFSQSLAAASALIGHRVAITRKVLKALAKDRAADGVRDTEAIRDAATKIPAIDQAHEKLVELASTAESNSEAIEEFLQAATNLAGDLKTKSSYIEQCAADSTTALDGARAAFAGAEASAATANASSTSLAALLADRESAVAASEERLRASIEQLASATSDLKTAQGELSKARADLNRQGLADAFRKRADTLGWSRRWYEAGFSLAIAAAVGLAILRAVNHDGPLQLTDLVLYLPAAGALIWLAFHLSRRANALARVVEDYEFKKASALTFEGYKREVTDADERLKAKLLRSAIETFGANPTRLMPSSRHDHTLPIEATAASLGKVLTKSADVIDRLRGKPGAPPS